MANVKTQNRNRMQARINKAGLKPGVPKAKVPALRPSTGLDALKGGPRMPSVTEPSGGPLARRPATDVLERAVRGGGEKFMGEAKRVPRALPPPASSGASAARGAGLASRLAGGLGLMAYSKPAGEGSDKPQNFPGEGLKAPAAFPQGRAESSIPAPKAAKAPAAKPKARPARSSEDDAFMADLRASATRMKADTAEAARATGRMKGAMEEFQSAATDAEEGFKRGGRVGGRGDGRAVRGRTKGRFI